MEHGMRKGDGEKPTKLHRVQMIVQDVRIMLPIVVTLFGGALYGNSEAVKNFVHRKPPPTVEDIQPVEDGHLDKSVEDIILKIKLIEGDIEALEGEVNELQIWHDED